MDIVILPAAAPNWVDPCLPNTIGVKRCQAVAGKLLAFPEARAFIIGGWPIRHKDQVVTLAEVMKNYLIFLDWRVKPQIALIDDRANCTVEDLNRLLDHPDFASLISEVNLVKAQPVIGFAGARWQFFRARRCLQARGFSQVHRIKTGEREIHSFRQLYWQVVANFVSCLDPTWQNPPGRKMVGRANDCYRRLVEENLGPDAIVA